MGAGLQANEWLAELFRPHFLIHYKVGGFSGNTYINESLGSFVHKQKLQGNKLAVVGVWRISARDYLRLKHA